MPPTSSPTRFALSLVASVFASTSWTAAAGADKPADETTAFFESGKIPVLKLTLSDEGRKSLRDNPREYVRASLHEDGRVVAEAIRVKLKGSAGSFQPLDERPGLTLNVDPDKKGRRFHGMKKFHLNNAVQDDTWLSEWLGAELFRAAGYPCPRVGHARVVLNDRDLGLYVVREGFDQAFLGRVFPDPGGNLYDGGSCQDVDSALERDAGKGRDERADLLGLAVACSEEDPAARWRGIADRIDIDQFVTFMALERLCGHWDGYTLNANNYRLYFPPRGKGVFLPHGMDQLFQDPAAGLYGHATPLVAAAVMQNDAWRQSYHERLKKLAPLVQPVDRWHAKIDAVQARLERVLKPLDAERAKEHRTQVQELKQRFAERAEKVAEMVKSGPPKPTAVRVSGSVRLDEWSPNPDGEEARLAEVEFDGVKCLLVTHTTFGDHSSSWQHRVLLPRGEYRLEARVRTEKVVAIPDGQGRGAGVRLSPTGRTDGSTGTTGWKTVVSDFSVREDQRSVEIGLELRARTGSAWFDRSSLQIRRVK